MCPDTGRMVSIDNCHFCDYCDWLNSSDYSIACIFDEGDDDE